MIATAPGGNRSAARRWARAEAPPWPPGEWREVLRGSVRTVEGLLAAVGLAPEQVVPAHQGTRELPVLVPPPYLQRIARADPEDPLLRQVLAVADEDLERDGFVDDPLGEAARRLAPGVLQKYAGRALLVTTGACAIHCRYCFRRHYPYGEEALARDLDGAIERIAASGVDEVILSGGDPLLQSDTQLEMLTRRLAGITAMRRLRLHTRVPIVLPQRVDRGLLSWIDALPWAVVVVVHANHPREIDADVVTALGLLRNRGVTLLNQSVLLRGVNDEVGVLAALSEALFEAGALPYYLHLLDRVRGAAHFEVPEAEGARLVGALAARLPGYLVPRLVREVEGLPAKRPVPFELPQAIIG